MPDGTTISWTDASWNPITGCVQTSPGCAHCYAKTFAERWRGVPGHPYEQGFDLRLWPERLDQPLRWARPRLIFTCSMSDLFYEGVPAEFIARVFGVMAAAQQHTFQVLTKRPERMADLLGRPSFRAMVDAARPGWAESPGWPLPNVWCGTSIESRRFVARANELRRTPAAVRFISAEPLLGPLIDHSDGLPVWGTDERSDAALREHEWPDGRRAPELDLRGVDWVIVGGESGPGARRMDLQWAHDLVQYAAAEGATCHVKQLGTVWARQYGLRGKAEDPGRWPRELRVREFPAAVGSDR